jgi:hypothetical protein
MRVDECGVVAIEDGADVRKLSWEGVPDPHVAFVVTFRLPRAKRMACQTGNDDTATVIRQVSIGPWLIIGLYM